jgi:hypothetical protein
MSSFSIKYFPFTPGIPWKLFDGKYIKPELSSISWQNISKNATATAICFGGLIESYLSLSALESINYISPNIKLIWAGDDKYKILCDINGLSKYTDDLPKDISSRFPTPIFFDKTGNIYFNCLLNYLYIKTYYGAKGYKNSRPIAKQIIDNNLIRWEQQFVPKLRKQTVSKELDQLIKINKLNQNIPIVIILPDKTQFTMHKIKCLSWTPMQVKSVATLLKHKNTNVIVFSDQPEKYNSIDLIVLPIKLEYILHFIPKALSILSTDIDFLFLANILSSAKIFTEYNKNQFNLNNNNKFFNKTNKIYKKRTLTPRYVFENIIGPV